LFVVCDKSILIGANGIPGWQTLNVGREEVLAGDWNSHLEDGAQDGIVGCGTAGTVHCANCYGKIVDDLIHVTP
jgi:hypothetical protein